MFGRYSLYVGSNLKSFKPSSVFWPSFSGTTGSNFPCPIKTFKLGTYQDQSHLYALLQEKSQTEPQQN